MSDAAPAPGLYVHVPFCLTRCAYCDFSSGTDQSLRGRWLAALEAEAEAASGAWGQAFDSVYIGGGTPSLLGPGEVGRLLGVLRRCFSIGGDAEVTLEANPDDLTSELAATWLELGVNRLSLGVQALDDEALELLGRRHDARASREAIRRARAAGFEDLGLDLIFALPGQTLSGWRRTLDEALALAPEHLSCYELTLEPHSPLGRRLARGELSGPREEEARELFLEADRRLSSAGFEHYEVSNYARGPGRRSRHNQKYWRRAPTLGLGPAAHSFDGEARRWWNVADLSAYVEALEAGRGTACAGEELLSAEQRLTEELMLGLRRSEGVPLELALATPGGEAALSLLVREGLIVVRGGRAAPTVLGLLVADGLPLRFL